MKSELFANLEDIVFAEKDAAEIESEIITLYENQSGRILARGDPVRLFLECLVLIIVQQRSLIDYAAKQNLLAYAEGAFLDYLGALLGVTRLEASHALTTLKFTLSETQSAAVIVTEGTRVSPGGGEYLFATSESVEIPAGESQVEVTAQCVESGTQGNGFVIGQIKKLVDPFPYEIAVENISESYGGSDIESDENFRERIQLAPESFSVAGPTGAYSFYARSAHQDIIDVAVVGPPETQPGHVNVYPLMTGGHLPTQEILDAVYETCNAEDVRPDTDFLHVLSPEAVEYELYVTYWIDRKRATQAALIQQAVENAVNGWVTWQRSKLGRDINPSELNHRMIQAGAKRTEIISPEFQVLTPSQVAIMSGITLNLGGLEDG